MKTVLIEYTVRPEADLEQVEAHIRDFVAGIGALDLGIGYTSHRRTGDSRRYMHLGVMPDERAQATLQAAPFFAPFGRFLRSVTIEPPRVTWLDVIATTA